MIFFFSFFKGFKVESWLCCFFNILFIDYLILILFFLVVLCFKMIFCGILCLEEWIERGCLGGLRVLCIWRK